MVNSGAEFLNKLYKDLAKDESVLIIDNQSKPSERIKKYLDLQQKLHDKISRSNHIDLLKHFYYEKYIIRKENIPDSYFESQKKIALELGYGHVEYNGFMKKQEIKKIISEQKKSLDMWLDYFLSEDSKFYPMWAKYWAFQGMLNIDKYDKEKERFTKRRKNTVAPFIELNREALALSIDYMRKYVEENKLTNDETLDKLINNGSFIKIYEYIINKLNHEKKEEASTNEGIWVKYDRGSDHIPLVKSLEGKGTGWCTAGTETAKYQLSCGDFHVYYSKDSEGNYTIPRVAIRMEYNRIAEVRGVAERQNLETEMVEIVDKKLDEFQDKEVYKKKAKDMKKLTEIYKKFKIKQDLSKEDLLFLYEVDDKIIGFGYQKDPRIAEIMHERNIKRDLGYALDLKEEEIGICKDDVFKYDIKFYYGDLDLSDLKSVENLKLPDIINGNLNLRRLVTAENLTFPKSIKKFLDIEYLKCIKNSQFPENIDYDVAFCELTQIDNLIMPQYTKGSIYFSRLTEAKNLKLPDIIEGSLSLNSLTTVDGVTFSSKIGGYFELNSLLSAKKIIFPKYIEGNFEANKLITLEESILPQIIGGNLSLKSLVAVKSLILSQYVGKSVNLEKLILADNLVLPNKIGGILNIKKLFNIDNLKVPNNFECQKIISKKL